MSNRLENKVAIICGAGQSPGQGLGNGRATALRFAQEGAQVICADRDLSSAQETAAQIQAEGGSALALACDVSQEQDCQNLMQASIEAYGAIHILHNNVGIGFKDNGVTHLELRDWQRIMDVNLTAMFLTSKHVVPIMRKQGSGVILNVSSVAAVAATPMVAYKTSKAGVNALTENLAMANAKYGIRVNCIMPGLMETPMAIEGYAQMQNRSREDVIESRNKMVPLGKMGEAWDIANAALFLASDEAKFITGVTLPVDGGQLLKVG